MANDGIGWFNEAGLRTLNGLTQTLGETAESFGKSITKAFAQGAIEGKRFEDVLRGIGESMTESLLQSAMKPLQGLLSNLLSTGLGSLVSGLAGGFGGGGGGLPVSFFADGGVVATPSYFAMGRGLGVMGERGAEAIMPLSRGPDGKLGVRASAAERRPIAISVQIATQDAASFRRSEAQVSAAIARAVARGNRAL